MILDTNVISELARPAPDLRVLAFVAENFAGGLALSAVTTMELDYGIAALPRGRRRDERAARVSALTKELIGPRILPFGGQEASIAASFMAARGRMGRSLNDHLRDAMIAATARVAGLPLATRNASDFEGLGLTLIDPWAAGTP